MRRRGSMLIQLLVGTAIVVVVMGALLQVLVSLWRMQSFSTGMPGTQDDARGIALRVADALRSATLCTTTDGGCTLDAAVESTSPTGATIYQRNDDGTLSELAYGVSNGNFTLSTSGGPATTFATGATLTLTYYSSSSYYSSGLTSFTPTSSTTPSLAAVGIVATTTSNGLTARFETFVRLRNSPKPSSS